MKGVIIEIDPDADIVDITSSVPAGDIMYGAFVLKFASAYFPPGTIHLAVVDPGVGGRRRAIMISGDLYTFIGPDNGLLMPAARAQGSFRVFEIANLEFFTNDVSPVFHGRDVFAPAAGYVSSGRDIPGLREINDPVELDFGKPDIWGSEVHGKVLYVDKFGNVITNIEGNMLKRLYRPGEMLNINGLTVVYVKAYSDVEKGQLITLVGSHGMAEVACNGGSASDLAELKPGSEIIIGPHKGKTY